MTVGGLPSDVGGDFTPINVFVTVRLARLSCRFPSTSREGNRAPASGSTRMGISADSWFATGLGPCSASKIAGGFGPRLESAPRAGDGSSSD